jgi:hypothetical protein
LNAVFDNRARSITIAIVSLRDRADQIKIRSASADVSPQREKERSMETTPCPLCGRIDGTHSHQTPTGSFDRRNGAQNCVICSGSLADHATADHAARVVERLAALGFPMPANVGMP